MSGVRDTGEPGVRDKPRDKSDDEYEGKQRSGDGFNDGGASGFVFRCTSSTEAEWLELNLFALEIDSLAQVEKVCPGAPLLVLNEEENVLVGMFHAACHGQKNLVPSAWDGEFPAQVRVIPPALKKRIPMSEVRPMLPDFGRQKLILLQGDQVINLCRLFEVGQNQPPQDAPPPDVVPFPSLTIRVAPHDNQDDEDVSTPPVTRVDWQKFTDLVDAGGVAIQDHSELPRIEGRSAFDISSAPQDNADEEDVSTPPVTRVDWQKFNDLVDAGGVAIQNHSELPRIKGGSACDISSAPQDNADEEDVSTPPVTRVDWQKFNDLVDAGGVAIQDRSQLPRIEGKSSEGGPSDPDRQPASPQHHPKNPISGAVDNKGKRAIRFGSDDYVCPSAQIGVSAAQRIGVDVQGGGVQVSDGGPSCGAYVRQIGGLGNSVGSVVNTNVEDSTSGQSGPCHAFTGVSTAAPSGSDNQGGVVQVSAPAPGPGDGAPARKIGAFDNSGMVHSSAPLDVASRSNKVRKTMASAVLVGPKNGQSNQANGGVQLSPGTGVPKGGSVPSGSQQEADDRMDIDEGVIGQKFAFESLPTAMVVDADLSVPRAGQKRKAAEDFAILAPRGSRKAKRRKVSLAPRQKNIQLALTLTGYYWGPTFDFKKVEC
ncbi:hypothetical protein BSKO_04901 [Bryopsis sp. KO-2023]|nr:hypothetical protein BSKO_04901 [Bryopsis sp. KO-2023]